MRASIGATSPFAPLSGRSNRPRSALRRSTCSVGTCWPVRRGPSGDHCCVARSRPLDRTFWGLQEILPSKLTDAAELVAPLTVERLDTSGFCVSATPDWPGSRLPLAGPALLLHDRESVRHAAGEDVRVEQHDGP